MYNGELFERFLAQKLSFVLLLRKESCFPHLAHPETKICPLIKFSNLETPDKIITDPTTKIGDKSGIIRMFVMIGEWGIISWLAGGFL